MAEDRLAFPHYNRGLYSHELNSASTHVEPFYYKYGGREAISLAMEEGGIGGKWEVT